VADLSLSRSVPRAVYSRPIMHNRRERDGLILPAKSKAMYLPLFSGKLTILENVQLKLEGIPGDSKYIHDSRSSSNMI